MSPAQKDKYVAPDADAKLHVSMTSAWKRLNGFRSGRKWEEWTPRLKLDGFYIPDAEPRMIESCTAGHGKHS